jgi:MerR family copper efflux transcriptional regulator
MDALTINEAAATTGWSARMLRYIEHAGLVVPGRSGSGYRLYGAPELQRLRTLKEMLGTHDAGLAEVGFVARMRDDAELRDAVEGWLGSEASRPSDVPAADWLSWEQEKHQRLLASIGVAASDTPTPATPEAA